MAQYFTDFSEYPTGLAPSDFSERWGTAGVPLTVKDEAGATGGKYLEVDSSSVKAATLIAWDILDSDPDTADIELLTRYRSSGFQYDTLGLAARGSGDSAATATAYLMFMWDGLEAKVSQYLNGSYSNVGEGVARSLSADTWLYQRSRINGTSIKNKFWLGTLADEPPLWLLERSSSAISGPGFAGLYPYRDFVFGYDMLSVGTNGDTAPSEAVGGGGAVAPSNAPEILSSINVTKNTVTGNFTFDDGANTGGSPTGFEVRVNGGTWEDLGNPSPKSFTVSGLTEGTTYNSPGVELRAYNATGSSPVSSPKIFTTSVSAPSVPAPRNLSTSEITENSALLTWEKGV